MSSKKRDKIMVAFGGKSVEHEISIITGLQALQSIDPTRYEASALYISPLGTWHTGPELLERSFYKKWQENLKHTQEVACLSSPSHKGFFPLKNGQIHLSNSIEVDVVLMAFHGQYGEDGCIQGVLDCAGIPYTSSPLLACATAMNKQICKNIVSHSNIETLPSLLISREQVRTLGISVFCEKAQSLFQEKGFNSWPLFIKPNNLGSSIGVSKASNKEELHKAVAYAMRYDHQVLIEPCLDQIIEIKVSVLDDESPRVSVIEIPVASEKILSYEDKYLRGGKNKTGKRSEGMAGLTRKIDPQDFDPFIQEKAKSWAKEAFICLGCAGVVRIDFMMDLRSGKLYFNELNTIPGSLAFYLWEKSTPRLLYPELLSHLIERAKKRAAEALCSERSIEFKALAR
jgi:D-alanine-D-alanine ligase